MKLSKLSESLHALCGMPCDSQVLPALTVLCDSAEERGERVQLQVRSFGKVESESIWAVSHFLLLGSVG